MKIIEPKVEFYTERNQLKRIERIARVCWHTESPDCPKKLKGWEKAINE